MVCRDQLPVWQKVAEAVALGDPVTWGLKAGSRPGFFYPMGGSYLHLGLNHSSQTPDSNLTLTAKLADLWHQEMKIDQA